MKFSIHAIQTIGAIIKYGSSSLLVSCPDPISHEEKGLVTIERFFGCAKSAVLILNEH